MPSQRFNETAAAIRPVLARYACLQSSLDTVAFDFLNGINAAIGTKIKIMSAFTVTGILCIKR